MYQKQILTHTHATGHHTGQTSLPLALNLHSSETARLLELERGKGEGLDVLELGWETVKPIHQA